MKMEPYGCLSYVYLKYASCMSREKKGDKIWLNQLKTVLASENHVV